MTLDAAYVSRAGLRVAKVLDDFVAGEVLAPLSVDVTEFWAGMADLFARFGPRNAELLARRDALAAQLDTWHREHHGAGDPADYRAFLTEIGYLEPDPGAVSIEVDGVDPEISSLAGPQLVTPLNNARFALNAANARWGSLYDALYGTDVLSEEDGATRGASYNPVRGERVIEYTNGLLDEIVPLADGSHAEVVSFEIGDVAPHALTATLADGRVSALREPSQFVGFQREATTLRLLLRQHGLHLEIVVDPAHPIGAQHPAGVADVVLEAALTTIQDCEDAVAAVDADDKVEIYRNWLGLMNGTLEATFEKGNSLTTRRLVDDRSFSAPDGSTFVLPGRSLLLVRNVGLHMMTDAVTTADGEEIPEGVLDAAITVAIAAHDLRGLGRHRNSRSGSIYIVKPKLHGSAEVAFAVDVFAAVEKLLGLPSETVKIGIMDEERRTSVNLAACIAAARRRVIFINTGFLDRTGDEIHTDMEAGPVIRKGDMKSAPWLLAYEDRNVDVGVAAGFRGVAQIGKGMWAAPEAMADMVRIKIAHPEAGGSCAWVPSPTAATLHAMHYHLVDVADRQAAVAKRVPVPVDVILELPLLTQTPTEAEIEQELSNNTQGILGYVVRWIDQGIGCSKVPDIHNVELMEDRATLRISSQHIANWLRHGIIDRETVVAMFEKMVVVVDAQNAGDPRYRPMATDLASSAAFCAALDLVFEGLTVPNGYTEPVLHRWRRKVKARIKAG